MTPITTTSTGRLGEVFQPNGKDLIGEITNVNSMADEITINVHTGGQLVVSASSLVPMNTLGNYTMAYEVGLHPDDAVSPSPEGRKDDAGKLDWSLLPVEAMDDVIRTLMVGAGRYGRENWRNVPGGYERYLAAAYRHITAIHKGEDLDPDDGLPHAAHAVCCLLFLGYFAPADHEPETGENE